jgi:hypothetical protein
MGATGRSTTPDPRLHHADGSHRTTAASANGRELDWFHTAMPRHKAEHQEQDAAQTVSVWTKNTSEAWLSRNAGISDMLLAVGLARPKAENLVERMRLMYGDQHLEIHPDDQPPVAGTVGSNI